MKPVVVKRLLVKEMVEVIGWIDETRAGYDVGVSTAMHLVPLSPHVARHIEVIYWWKRVINIALWTSKRVTPSPAEAQASYSNRSTRLGSSSPILTALRCVSSTRNSLLLDSLLRPEVPIPERGFIRLFQQWWPVEREQNSWMRGTEVEHGAVFIFIV